MSPPNPEDFGTLGQSEHEHEALRIARLSDPGERRRAAEEAAERLNEAQADIPMREDFGKDEGESYDTPEMVHDTIARMKASRAPNLVRAAYQQPTRSLDPPRPPAAAQARQEPQERRAPPALRADSAGGLAAPVEVSEVIRAVVGQLATGLQHQFEDLRKRLEENTELLGVMNAPMEAITDSHERAAQSFETLRSDIGKISGTGAAPAIAQLTRALDTAGLNASMSAAERRTLELTSRLEARMDSLAVRFEAALGDVTKNMISVLALLERLQARELREIKRRSEVTGDTGDTAVKVHVSDEQLRGLVGSGG